METQTKLRTEQEARRLLELEADAIFGIEHQNRQDRPIGTFTPHGVNNRHVYGAHLWSPQAQFTVTQGDISLPMDEESSRQNYIPGEIPLLLYRLCSSLNLPLSYIQGGPSYEVPLDITQQPRAALPILTSSGDDVSQVCQRKGLARPDNWEVDEWAELLDGKLGPWAMAVDGTEPVCICFSARRTPKAAEAGIWTHSRHRGRGLAPAIVAAWARLEAPGKEAIFYSTSASNTASQSVALKLNLKPLGWVWKLEKPAGEETQ